MRVVSPTFALVSLLAAAALVLGGGWKLSARVEETRTPPDQVVLREFVRQFQRELQRLETVYLRNLRQLAAETQAVSDFTTRQLSMELCGVVQISEVRGSYKRHLAIRPEVKLPIPVFEKEPAANREVILLSKEEVFPAEGISGSGWLEPGDKRFWIFWAREGEDSARLFLLDRNEVLQRLDAYLAKWLEKPYAPVRAAKGLQMATAPGGAILAGNAPAPAREPDVVLPLVSRFGDWTVFAWDQVMFRTVHDPQTISVALLIAAALILLGFVVFFQQKQAARLAEQRVSFVNRVSHELGTPLTNILLNLDLIEEANGGLPPEARQRFQLLREEARRLSRLVANVLTFSGSERKSLKVHFSPQVPDDILRSVLQQFQPALERRGIVLTWQDAAKDKMDIDADAFAQIIANLVSNVEKYAAEGKRIDLESRQENGELVVRVSDQGPGIPRSHAVRVFQPFERVDSRVNEGSSGTGLGLAIARDLAQAMGGRLSLLDSAQGTVFEFRMPKESR